MRTLSALRGAPIAPAVTGSGEEGCPREDVRMLSGGEDPQGLCLGPGREALKQGHVNWGCFSPARGHWQCLEILFIVTTGIGVLLASGGLRSGPRTAHHNQALSSPQCPSAEVEKPCPRAGGGGFFSGAWGSSQGPDKEVGSVLTAMLVVTVDTGLEGSCYRGLCQSLLGPSNVD